MGFSATFNPTNESDLTADIAAANINVNPNNTINFTSNITNDSTAIPESF